MARTREVPFIPQLEAVECGAASLAMVLAYHGHHAPLSEVRQACGVSRDGSTAKNIVVAARRYGLVPRARRLEPRDLAGLAGPAILHWEMNHFVVLERWRRDHALIVDPGEGRRTIEPEHFDESFTGICIELAPGEAFVKRAQARVSLDRYRALFSGAWRALVMVLVASLALNLLSLSIPLSTQAALDQVIGRRRVEWLEIIAASALGLATFHALYQLLRGSLLLRLRRALDVSIASSFVEHLLDLPVPFFTKRPTADLMARVQSTRTIRDVLAGQSVALLASGVTMLVSLGIMFAYDARLATWVALAAALYVGTYLIAQPSVRVGADRAQRKSVASATARLQLLKGIATIKSAGRESTSRSRWLSFWIEAINASSAVALREQLVATVLLAIQAAVPMLLLWDGGRRVIAGELSAGRLVAFQMLQASFLVPLDSIIQTLLHLQVVPVLLDRMDDVLQSEREPTRARVAPRLDGEIVLDDVSFRYGPTTPLVLKNISLRIRKGAKVALVGPSGCGKSTLARLLLGLYEPTQGRVLLDGNDLSTLDLGSVRRQFGVVLQETALFEGTIADNLRLFYPNLPLDRLVQAARVAQIHDDIQALPQGYETPIASNGCAFSGGQRQRLALARAIVHRPPIMVLDEATSALDSVTEAAIERYLSTRSCTRVVIAHRLSTVRDADVICVLDGGRIVEQGTHEELASRGGRYAELVASGGAQGLVQPQPKRQGVSPGELSRFPLLSDWSEQELTGLACQLSRVDFVEGTRVVEQDARAAGLFLLLEGRVRIEIHEPGLASWTVAELGPGAVVGEVGLLDGSPSSANVVATTGVRMLALSHTQFRDLARRGDALAVRLTLSLGSIVAQRLRGALERLEEVTGGAPSRLGQSAPDERAPTRELRLEQTPFAAALPPHEVAALATLGKYVSYPLGASILVEGEPSDSVVVLLSGSAETRRGSNTLAAIGTGTTLGEVGLFDDGPCAMSAVAVEPCSALVFPRDHLVDLLTSGQTHAPRLLAPIVQALVRSFRVASSALREAAALLDGEIERAHEAREAALAAAREEHEALLDAAPGHLRRVAAARAEDTPAACLASLLRAWGRPVALASVLDAFASYDESPLDEIGTVARWFGLASRRLDLRPGDLLDVSEPVVAVLTEGNFVILEPKAGKSFRVVDPLREDRTVTTRELSACFAGVAFEIRQEAGDTTGSGAQPLSLLERVTAFGRDNARHLGRLGALSLAGQAFAVAVSLATATAVATAFPLGDDRLLGVLVAGAAAFGLTAAFLHQAEGRAIEHLRARFDRELLDQLMAHVLRLPISFFDRTPAGELLQRFQAFENVRVLFSTQGVAALLSVGTLLAAGTLLLAFAPVLASLALLTLIFHAIVIALAFGPLSRAAKVELAARGRAQERLLEILGGIVTLRMSGERSAAYQRWLPTFSNELSASLRQEKVRVLTIPLLEWARAVATIGCLTLGAHAVLRGSLGAGAFVGFLGALAAFFGATSALASQTLALAPSSIDYDLVRSTFLEAHEQSGAGLVAPGQLRGNVTVEHVSFRYGSAGPMVLRDISLDIRAGMKVALVGASGSGKSTLGKLLLGMYLPTSGRILIDGKDVASLDLQALRRRIGAVLQEPHLMAGSIRDNIAMGAESAPLARVVEAAQRAALHDDIEKMPMGYSTLVSEGGSAFSGGQRQRCVIARAMLGSPALLLLDEATSALDNLSQAVVERHLAESTATRIVVAHRLSTVIDADLIVVLDRGRIVEQGTHDSLLRARGAYHDLVRAQLEPERIAEAAE